MDSTKQEPTDEVYIMHDTENYIKFSLAITTPVIEYILDEFEDECREMKGKCLEIGCGAGNYSRELILPRLSSECSLVGVDISKNMIDCARKLCADEKRITFKVMDIETTDLEIEDIGAYDNGLSFFCLHWLRDLRLGFENIYKLMKPGGSFIAALVVESCMLFAYPKLAEYPQYKEYMKDYTRYTTCIHYEKNPSSSLKKICQEVGFEVMHVSKREALPGFKNEEELLKFLVTLNPFIDRMPESMHDEYKRDLLKESLKRGQFYKRVERHSFHEQTLFGKYKYMVIHLKKPYIQISEKDEEQIIENFDLRIEVEESKN